MTKTHLNNALNYTINNSSFIKGEETSYIDLESGIAELMNESSLKYAIDHLGDYVTCEEIYNDWSKDFSNKKNSNEAMHLVFSINEPISKEIMYILENSVRDSVLANLPEYKWVMIPHSHQNQPHIHLILNKTNIFNKKKMHFDKRNEFVDLFESMKENFKYNLFSYSNGKLDYTNEVYNHEFRLNFINKNINKLNYLVGTDLEEFNQTIESIELFDNHINTIDIRRNNELNKFTELKKEFKNKNIYLSNISKKIDSITNFTPENLINKKLQLEQEISMLKNKIKISNNRIKELNFQKKCFNNDKENIYFESLAKGFTDFQKKKAILKSFNGIESSMSKDVIDSLNKLKFEVKNTQDIINNNFEKLNLSIFKQIRNDKNLANTYQLAKDLNRLHRYKSIVDKLELDPSKKIFKDKAIDEFSDNENFIKNLMLQRFNYLNELIEKYEQNLDKFLLDYENNIDYIIDNSNSYKEFMDIKRSIDRIKFIKKEIGIANKLCVKYGLIKNKEKIKTNKDIEDKFNIIKDKVEDISNVVTYKNGDKNMIGEINKIDKTNISLNTTSNIKSKISKESIKNNQKIR